MLSPENIANIILHIVIAASFIIIFFFTYGSYLEGQVVREQMNFIVDDLAGDLKNFLPDVSNALKANISASNTTGPTEQDEIVAAKNKKLKMWAFIILAIGVVVCLAVVSGMAIYFKFPLKHIAISNTISIIAVGLTYLLFSKYYIAQYMTADPNFVKRKALEGIGARK